MPNRMNYLLEWMLDYEIRSSQRYGHRLSLVVMTSGDHRSIPKKMLAGTVRRCDEFFDLGTDSVVLMGETGREGALCAVERFGFTCNGEVDLRFGVASYPEDGDSREVMLEVAKHRLRQALKGTQGPVVTAG